MKPEDVGRLEDMLAAARDAMDFAKGRSAADLQTDRMFFLALVKAVEIVGEAASRVSEETRTQHPQIEWAGIIGMRNILVHAYASIDGDELWVTVQEDLPHLIAELERIIMPPDPPLADPPPA
jgi:uncharacterized protein with HEPN domain